MIEVPEEIQAALKRDGIHKEFTVHFPNGECPDITNSNIVSESVKFNESVCSQQQFKYGLAEASSLEFEFVDEKINGIPKWGNIKGMEIEAGIKYDFDPAIVETKQVPLVTDVFSNEMRNRWVKEMPTDCTSAKMTFYDTRGYGLVVYGAHADGTYAGRGRSLFINRSYTFQGYDYWVNQWSDSNVTRIFYGIEVGDPQYLPQYLKLEETTTSLGTTVICDRVVTTYNDFTIPYGVFTVESCPRNHGDMAHRKVTAYTESISTNDNLPGYEKYKLQTAGWPTSSLTYDTADIMNAWLRKIDMEHIIESYEGTTTNTGYNIVSTQDDIRLNFGFPAYIYINDDLASSFEKINIFGDFMKVDSTTQKFGYVKKRTKYSMDEILSFMDELAEERYNFLISQGCRISSWGYEANRETIAQKLYKYINSIKLDDIYDLDHNIQFQHYFGSDNKEYITFPNELYSRLSSHDIKFKRLTNIVMTGGEEYRPVGPSISATHKFLLRPVYDIYKMSGITTLDLQIKFNSTLDTQVSGSQTRYLYYNSYSYKAMFDGLLELMAEYAKPAREGGLKTVELNDDSPYEITPSDYSECWWEEYEVEPIGAVRYKYTVNNEDQEVVYSFGEGTSVYDMGANAFFDKLASKSESIINGLLDTYFIPKLQYIRFVPVDLTMRALPFLEAGDCLQIEAEDSTIIKTYIMNQSIDGIQSLEADISSVDGSIIETDISEEAGV